MAIVKQYGLSGVADDLQLGKGGGRLKYDTDHFKARDPLDNNYVRLKTSDPVDATDVATKFYVDSVAQGLNPKEAVVVSTNNLAVIDSNVSGGLVTPDMGNLGYGSGPDEWTLNAGATLDGYVLLNNDRVLIKDATGGDMIGNGIFVYTSATKKFTRAPDSDNVTAIGSEFGGGTFVFVLKGQVWGSTGWIVNSPIGVANFGTDPINFVQFSKATGIYATDGLAQDGNRLYVRTDGTTIYLDNDDVAVKSSGTPHQVLRSNGSGGTATWGALDLGEPQATSDTLLRSRGGLAADVSGFIDQSLYVSNLTGNNTIQLAPGANHTILRIDGAGNLGYGGIDISQAGVITGALDETHGGTGETSYTQYDLLVGDGSSKLGKFGIGSNYQVLGVDGFGVLTWRSVQLDEAAAVAGILPESHGGTGIQTYTKSDIIYAGSTGGDGVLTTLGIGSTSQVLQVNSSGNPIWDDLGTILSQIELTRQVAITTATTNIGANLPAYSRVVSIKIHITTPYTGTNVAMTIGDAGNNSRLMESNEIDLETSGLYQIELHHNYGSVSEQVVAYIGGSATGGAGYIILTYITD
jgi:hypothetical protein